MLNIIHRPIIIPATTKLGLICCMMRSLYKQKGFSVMLVREQTERGGVVYLPVDMDEMKLGCFHFTPNN